MKKLSERMIEELLQKEKITARGFSKSVSVSRPRASRKINALCEKGILQSCLKKGYRLNPNVAFVLLELRPDGADVLILSLDKEVFLRKHIELVSTFSLEENIPVIMKRFKQLVDVVSDSYETVLSCALCFGSTAKLVRNDDFDAVFSAKDIVAANAPDGKVVLYLNIEKELSFLICDTNSAGSPSCAAVSKGALDTMFGLFKPDFILLDLSNADCQNDLDLSSLYEELSSVCRKYGVSFFALRPMSFRYYLRSPISCIEFLAIVSLSV